MLPKVLLQLIFEYSYFEDILEEYYNIIYVIYSKSETFDKSFKLFPKVKKIILTNNENLTNKYIKDLPRSLQHLDLGENGNLTNECIKDLPRTLQHLNLYCNKNINKELIKQILPNCKVI